MVTKSSGHTLKVDVPKHWKVVPLGDVLTDIVGGGTPSKSNPDYWKGSIPWLTVKDMRTRRPEDAIDHISEEAVEYSATNIIPADTVIIATRVGLGKVIRVSFESTINQDLKALVVGPDVDKGYLEYWILSIANYLESIGSGTTVKGIRLEQLRSIPFPLAPLHEQKLIVAEIEKQFSRLDEAVAGLKRVKANLKRYKAAVLKAAVEGRLVETEAKLARREGRSYETGGQLLTRILEERRRQWKGKGKYKEPVTPDTTGLPELPEGCVWVTVDQLVAHLTDGDHQPPPQTDHGIPFLVIGNVRNGEIDFSDTRFVGEAYYKKLDPYRQPKKGDLLYTLVGSYGIPVRVKTDKPFCIQRHMAILRPNKKSPMSYLTIAMASASVFKQATAVATGTAQKTVPLAGLRKIAISLPPEAEQARIVAEVERRLSLVREVEAQVESNLLRSESLRQAVLKEAFCLINKS